MVCSRWRSWALCSAIWVSSTVSPQCGDDAGLGSAGCNRHVQQRSIGGGIAWPTELLRQMNDRTGHTHTTSIEQWIHNHRLRSFHHRVPGRPGTTHENLSEGNARR